MKKNLCIITSTISPPDLPLSYIQKRSIYSPEERFAQTQKTIESVEKYISDCDIVVLDNSPIPIDMQDYLVAHTSAYIDYSTRAGLDRTNPNKGISECDTMRTYLRESDSVYKYYRIYKLSGRYSLTEEFDQCAHDAEINMHVKGTAYSTIFYNFSNKHIDTMSKIYDHIVETNSSDSIEYTITNMLCDNKNNIREFNVVGVTGRIAVDGSTCVD